jgi:hypothetical protein
LVASGRGGTFYIAGPGAGYIARPGAGYIAGPKLALKRLSEAATDA